MQCLCKNKCTNYFFIKFDVYCFVWLAFIQPICLPLSPAMKNIDIENNLPFIAGWGADVEGKLSTTYQILE